MPITPVVDGYTITTANLSQIWLPVQTMYSNANVMRSNTVHIDLSGVGSDNLTARKAYSEFVPTQDVQIQAIVVDGYSISAASESITIKVESNLQGTVAEHVVSFSAYGESRQYFDSIYSASPDRTFTLTAGDTMTVSVSASTALASEIPKLNVEIIYKAFWSKI